MHYLVCLGYLAVTLSSFVSGQRRELAVLSALGWRPWIVQRLFVQEGMTLAVIGAVPGVFVALGILLLQHGTSTGIPAPLIGLGALLLLILVAGLATIPALRAVNRMHLGDVLRAE